MSRNFARLMFLGTTPLLLLPFAYDSVRVGPRVPLAAIATAAGTTVPVIQELNPHILRGMTPPRDSMKVRIPVGTIAQFDAAFNALPEEARLGAKVVTMDAKVLKAFPQHAMALSEA